MFNVIKCEWSFYEIVELYQKVVCVIAMISKTNYVFNNKHTYDSFW